MKLACAVLVAFAALAAAEPVPVEIPRPVAVKVFRPGISGVAAIIPKGSLFVSYGYSHEDPSRGASLEGLSAFYEFGLGHGMAVYAATGHLLSEAGHAGMGDTAIGLKSRIVPENRWMPLMSLSYSYKQPTAAAGLGSGYADHKAMWYADKNFGPARVTLNFSASFLGAADGWRRMYVSSAAVIAPVRGRLGYTAQTYWSTLRSGYGGAVAAPTWHVTPNCAIYAGLMQNYGRGAGRTGVVAGLTWLHRPGR